MNDHTDYPAPPEIKAAVAAVGERIAQRVADVPDDAVDRHATDTQQTAVALLRVLLTGADSLVTALASGDDDAVDLAVSAVAADPLLRDLAAHRPGTA
jgi:hypothetical protein